MKPDDDRLDGSRSAWSAPGLAPAAGSLARARIEAVLLAAAGVLGFIGVVLPHPSGFNELGLVAVQAVAVVVGAALFAGARRAPTWVVRLNPPLSVIATSLAVYFSNDATSAYALFYLWPAVYAFYFFTRLEALLTVAFAAANYAAVIAILGGFDGGASDSLFNLVLTVGTLTIIGGSLVALRERVTALIAQIAEAARTDPLTGLRSRRGLREDLEGELERARLGHRSVSLLVADLDHFRRVNEQFGQRVGDRVLRRFAALLGETGRRLDTPARTGGEEFALLMPEIDKHAAYMVAERLRARVRDAFSGEQTSLTISIGISGSPEDGGAADELLRMADEALYAAKTLGRDRSVLYSRDVTSIIGDTGDRRGVRSQAHLATMLSLAEALDLRDSGTARHSQTVGRLCELVARELGLPKERVERVRIAGILHDIGKIGIPDAILRKPGPLTEEERVQINRHPEVAARLLGAGELEDIRSWILAHHERPDGNGYPAGIRADEIPLEAGILAVGDAFEAMTADRVYRPGIGEQAARRELRTHAGTQFNRRVVEALEAVLDRVGLEQLAVKQ